MHPGDQFEAFRELAETRGWGAEEIAARFGVTAHVVKQRLRFISVSTKPAAGHISVLCQGLACWSMQKSYGLRRRVWF